MLLNKDKLSRCQEWQCVGLSDVTLKRVGLVVQCENVAERSVHENKLRDTWSSDHVAPVTCDSTRCDSWQTARVYDCRESYSKTSRAPPRSANPISETFANNIRFIYYYMLLLLLLLGFTTIFNILGHQRRFRHRAWKVRQILLIGSNFGLRFFYVP